MLGIVMFSKQLELLVSFTGT